MRYSVFFAVSFILAMAIFIVCAYRVKIKDDSYDKNPLMSLYIKVLIIWAAIVIIVLVMLMITVQRGTGETYDIVLHNNDNQIYGYILVNGEEVPLKYGDFEVEYDFSDYFEEYAERKAWKFLFIVSDTSDKDTWIVHKALDPIG